ncbi:alpha-amylase family glycosyl hydrolase [Umboniibacter marinipuniceus]|uniref:Alpha-amylase n=1 Tax=Umboniibacter marinipuniceus TaxID=569599 RepID=A0A3M0A2C3_9GAMM|nr:alpha-amylase family glycosyl hydrolase [Umboniibacter marinipuniceus]RMA78797.1 alpha-amylase [Umboniibacter marinipuniceus]
MKTRLLFSTLMTVITAITGVNAVADQSAPKANPNTFVHLFEWRWEDIAAECRDHLPGLGYDAIQVSPAIEHIDHPSWWARYQPVDFSKFESFSGGEEALRSMIETCHAAGIKVYADAVINHTADYGEQGVGTAGTPWEIMQHPGLDESHYHHPICTIEDYSNADEVQNCRLGALPDLNTSDSYVRELLAAYLRKLSELGFDGMRIDAAKHMSAADVAAILELAGGPNVFLEVIGDPSAETALQPSTYAAIAPVTDFATRGAIYSAINGDLSDLASYWRGESDLSADMAVTFVDNHDTERHTQPLSIAQKQLGEALLLTLGYGYPKVLSGYQFENRDALPSQAQVSCEQGWTCWHRDPIVSQFVQLRRAAGGAQPEQLEYLDDQVLAFSYGPGRVLVNVSNETKSVSWDPQLSGSEYCDLLAGHGSVVELGWWGDVDISLPPHGLVLLREDAVCSAP